MHFFNILPLLIITSCIGTTALEVPSVRTFSYVGGEYADDGSGTGERIFRNQLYVERIAPFHHTSPKPNPVIFIHGQGQTGTNFLNKPDGGRGWASNFIEAGYTVYIIDQTFRGRSPWQPGQGAASPSTYSAELIARRFTNGAASNLWPQAHLQTQWPGNGTIGDPIFDAFYASNVQFILNATLQQSTVQNAGAALLDQINVPSIVIGHSQGGIMPFLLADARPQHIHALILLEPSGPPFQEAVFSTNPARRYGLTDIPLTYSPPVTDPALDLVRQVYPPPIANEDNSTVPCILQAQSPPPRQLPNFVDVPMLLVTGEASYHAPYDYCTVEYLRQAGAGRVHFLELGKEGIKGNGHLSFLERNSDEIWERVRGFIEAI
ncbi:hypothetical protein CAC42_946 [Sphaceloma murrayae]|uniref:AB hydrolase-1 domain-containing protein n=1 Tax=Sphaceloma murrayae TaxID=2082308 RepID=A0A2K1R2S1_9PEZI|nr:hypothetical protein CAC42_946 [Sphaceloma murrayae]